MEYETTRVMPADSRTVFDIAADVSTMSRWLPREIEIHPVAPDVAEAESRFPGSGEEEGVMRTAPDQLRLEWGARGRPDYTGWLQVTDRADGGSEVVIHLSFLGHQPAASDAPRAHGLTEHTLDQTLDRLADEVSRRARA